MPRCQVHRPCPWIFRARTQVRDSTGCRWCRQEVREQRRMSLQRPEVLDSAARHSLGSGSNHCPASMKPRLASRSRGPLGYGLCKWHKACLFRPQQAGWFVLNDDQCQGHHRSRRARGNNDNASVGEPSVRESGCPQVRLAYVRLLILKRDPGTDPWQWSARADRGQDALAGPRTARMPSPGNAS